MSIEETNKPISGEATPGHSIREWFNDFFDLREGSDRAGAVQSIVSGKLMRGSNAWMLVCSIMIASLGLNLNSGAVIIGAMLISPLMNPILGVGLGIGTNDRDMLWQALKNFGIAIVIALITSIVYFAITPISEFTPEIQARTAPTILDGMVAVFGGLAGIISITRLDKTNAIPGVAIATALMPPLCVAGYGIVEYFTGDAGKGLSIFWRAGYLFFLNSFFIAITAYIIIRLLRFPYRTYVNAKEKRRSQLIIGLVSVLMLLPGIYVTVDVYSKVRNKNAAKAFTEKYFEESKFDYSYIDEHKDSLILVYPGKNIFLNRDTVKYYTNILRDSFKLNIYDIRTNTDGITVSTLAGIQGRLDKMGGLTDNIDRLETRLLKIESSQQQINRKIVESFSDSVRFDLSRQTLIEQFSDIEEVYFANVPAADSTGGYTLVAVQRSRQGPRLTTTKTREEREEIRKMLEILIKPDSLVLVVEGM
ncbi:DUF389 domain-containing protein [Neolewinella persica]|uniref:DUF389 domain-containing protein n=1 Tax=Neolewinella persica TaxID=70998 RepID=UPI0003825FA0|nr:DUF389 domain-containing protein [Neolewinella persica]